MAKNKSIAVIAAVSILISMFSVFGTILAGASAEYEVSHGTLPDTAEGKEYYTWVAELVSSNPQTGADMNQEADYRFRNKATGLYLTEQDGELALAEKDASSNLQVWRVKDNWTNKYLFFNVQTQNYICTDGNMTQLGPNGVTAGDGKSDGVNSGNGFEMVTFIDASSGETTNSIPDGGSFYIKNRDYVDYLCATDISEIETTPVTAYDAGANGMPTTDTDNYLWEAEIIEGTGAGNGVTKLYFRNKATGLYLAEIDGQLVQIGDKSNPNAVIRIQDFYNFAFGNLWTCFTVNDNYLGTDGTVTQLGKQTDSSGDHSSDGIFNSEGYELINFSADNGASTVNSLSTGTAYMIYTTFDGKVHSILKAENPAASIETTPVTAYDAGANGMPMTDTDNYLWEAEIIEGTGAGNGVTKLYFRNKATGLYLAEIDGELAQIEDKSNPNAVIRIQDFYNFAYGNLWTCFTVNDNYLGTDGTVTQLGKQTDSSGDHSSDGIFNAEGYELINFSTDNGASAVNSLSTGTAYMIYTTYDGKVHSILKGENRSAVSEPETTPVSSYNVAANGMPTADTDKYLWEAEIIEGTGATGGVTKLYLKNKATGLYLAEIDGELAQIEDKSNPNAVIRIQDNWGYLWLCFTANDNYLGTDGTITQLGKKTDSSGDHRTDGIFNADGYEMVQFSSDNGQTDASTITTGTAYMIYTRDNGAIVSLLAAGEGEEEIEVTLPEVVDPDEAIAYTTNAYDVSKNGLPQESERDQYLWRAIRSGDAWVFQNVQSGLVLTNNNGTLIQESYLGERFQNWIVQDNYGYLWKMYSQKGQMYLSTDGVINRLGTNMESDGNHEADGINNLEWYEMVHFSMDGITEAKTLVNGKCYYIYNLVSGDQPDVMKQILGGTAQETAPALPVVPDTPMEGQDEANDAIDISEPLELFMTPLSSVEKKGSQIWIFREVELEEEFPSIWNVIAQQEQQLPSLTKGYTIQNKETGLYLTDVDQSLYQTTYDGSDAQIWVIENYPFGAHPDLNIVRNYASGYQMILEQNTYGLYDPVGYEDDPLLQESWPGLVDMNGGPLAGIATVSFARVTTDINSEEYIWPEDGKGYYMYCNGYGAGGAGGSLLEAVNESVENNVAEEPEIPKYDYSKDLTFVQDFENEITTDDLDWDCLFDARAEGGVLVGSPSDESGIYGIALRHKTYGRGTTQLSFRLNIPEYTSEYVSIALRLNDYYDIAAEQTGFRIYVNRDGRVGMKFAGSSDMVTYVETGYSFVGGRNVYVSDDAETNVITLSFDNDQGVKTTVATFTVDRGNVTMTTPGENGRTISKFYGYNIYRDGYMSITTDGFDVTLDDLKVVTPIYSSVKFAEEEKPQPSDPEQGDPSTEKPGSSTQTGENMLPTLILLTALPVAGTAAVLTAKRREKGKKASR